ncbi:MAG: hypothetical protein ACYC9Z_17560 [Casimicrobiaceae bacterium]
MTARYWTPPKPGDIVHCRFPQGVFANPGPKERPALVTKVETREDSVDVEVAYGTSQGIDDVHAGELVVLKDDPDAGLQKDTKFDLCNIVKLPFNEDWFAPDPLQRFGKHPRRGKFNLDNAQNKKKLHAAVIEARHAGKVPIRHK